MSDSNIIVLMYAPSGLATRNTSSIGYSIVSLGAVSMLARDGSHQEMNSWETPCKE